MGVGINKYNNLDGVFDGRRMMEKDVFGPEEKKTDFSKKKTLKEEEEKIDVLFDFPYIEKTMEVYKDKICGRHDLSSLIVYPDPEVVREYMQREEEKYDYCVSNNTTESSQVNLVFDCLNYVKKLENKKDRINRSEITYLIFLMLGLGFRRIKLIKEVMSCDGAIADVKGYYFLYNKVAKIEYFLQMNIEAAKKISSFLSNYIKKNYSGKNNSAEEKRELEYLLKVLDKSGNLSSSQYAHDINKNLRIDIIELFTPLSQQIYEEMEIIKNEDMFVFLKPEIYKLGLQRVIVLINLILSCIKSVYSIGVCSTSEMKTLDMLYVKFRTISSTLHLYIKNKEKYGLFYKGLKMEHEIKAISVFLYNMYTNAENKTL